MHTLAIEVGTTRCSHINARGKQQEVSFPTECEQLCVWISEELNRLFPTSLSFEQDVAQADLLIPALDEYPLVFAEHTRRVTRYAVETAKLISSDPRFICLVRAAALIHDINKIEWTRDPEGNALLDMWHKATDLQYETIIQPHAARGAQRIAEHAASMHMHNNHVARILHDVTRDHHTPYNVLITRYSPELHYAMARLITEIVKPSDATDAMLTRPYNVERFGNVESAIEEIQRCSGSQFDPLLVGPFITFMRDNKGVLVYELGKVNASLQRHNTGHRFISQPPPPLAFNGRPLRMVA